PIRHAGRMPWRSSSRSRRPVVRPNTRLNSVSVTGRLTCDNSSTGHLAFRRGRREVFAYAVFEDFPLEQVDAVVLPSDGAHLRPAERLDIDVVDLVTA